MIRAFSIGKVVLDPNHFILYLGEALILGAAVGFERQWRQSMAGTRTNALVAAGSATFVMVGYMFAGDLTAPGRIAGQIASGIGFLGAGVILKEGASVRGLNTAATVWCSSAIGVMAGIGHPLFALFLTLGILVTNIVFRPLSYKLHPDLNSQVGYHIEMTCEAAQEASLRKRLLESLNRKQFALCQLRVESVDRSTQVEIAANSKSSTRRDDDLNQFVTEFARHDTVRSVNWRLSAASMED